MRGIIAQCNANVMYTKPICKRKHTPGILWESWCHLHIKCDKAMPSIMAFSFITLGHKRSKNVSIPFLSH